MLNKTNLALAMDTSYNYKDDKIHLSKVNFQTLMCNQLLIQTKHALILRENILASGMEVSDIKKANDLTIYAMRR